MPRGTPTSTRDRILDATAGLTRSAGLSALTTREIARATGLTEAALYRHSKNKEDLLTSALAERLPVFIELLKELPQFVGRWTSFLGIELEPPVVSAFAQDLVDTLLRGDTLGT